MNAVRYTEQLHTLLRVFLEENTKLNLSALRTEEQCWTGNILDSTAFLELADIVANTTRYLDIGTGGGFPLLPLAICLPKSSWTGLDATRKKIDAIGRIVHTMELNNVQLVSGRTEELGHDPRYREQYDCVVARAVAPLATLLEYMSPFVRKDGYLVCWKSIHSTEEIDESVNAQEKLSCILEKQHEYDLGGDWGKRQLLVFRKTGALNKAYPRIVGEPKKSPL